jgi:hypothetical protein
MTSQNEKLVTGTPADAAVHHTSRLVPIGELRKMNSKAAIGLEGLPDAAVVAIVTGENDANVDDVAGRQG